MALAQGETVAQACRGIGPYVLPMAPAVWWAEDRPGEAVAGDGSGERTTQACGSGPDVGQPDSKGGSTGKLLSPARRRRCVELARERYGISERRACRALEQPRSTQRYTATMADDEEALTMPVVRLASRYGRYGYRRVTAMLQWEGWRVNHKRVERIWRRGGLKVPAKQPKRGRLWLTDGSCVRLRPQRRNHVWAYDFVALRTSDGKPVRLLTVVGLVGTRFRGLPRSGTINRSPATSRPRCPYPPEASSTPPPSRRPSRLNRRCRWSLQYRGSSER